MKKKVTMQDIADRLNISKNSVSQALTGKPGVSEETRDLVKNAAMELGYDYPKARQLANGKKQGSIALIASDLAFSLKSFFGEIFLSIEKEAVQRGMTLQIQSINKEATKQLILPSFIENQSVDGIIILSHISNDYINKVIATGIPTVMIDHHHPTNQSDVIITNNRFGAYTAVEHLIQLGHKDIAYIGNVDYSPSYQERYEGYLHALRDHRLSPVEPFTYTDAVEEENIIFDYIQNLPNKPTAWFCVNDGLGFLVSSCLQQQGYKVPQDASVCSYDNGQLSQLANPKITTMNIDLELYGKKAVEQLCWRMENRGEPFQEILISSELVKRDSTSSPPVRVY
ncbi:substrate-binding domain-containing protein [Rossellomorea vietnamensis]|uniref:substrate-binding domain-containing protein n=1 Tax=Rossellomorea vietnamensis TaxID=218284 RepID=UPI00308A1339|nr:substrate-binding domain-containing protein [Rossellomorea vietnamensis]